MRSISLMTGLAALTVLSISACSTQPRYDNAYDVRGRCETCGNIERIERVRLRDGQTGIGAGAVLGAIIGGVAGSQIANSDHQKVGIAAGAVAGGVVGHQIQKSNQKQKNGYQFDIRLDDGRWAQVTQLEKNRLRVGDRVIIQDDQLVYLR